MRVYTLKPPRTLPFTKTTSWDGVTYYAGLPSASSSESVPVHGPGTYYPIEFSLPEIYKLLFYTQLAEFKLDVNGSSEYDDGSYVTTHSYSGSYKLPMARDVVCSDNPTPVYPRIQPAYVIQNQEYEAVFGIHHGVLGDSLSTHQYSIPPPAVEVYWASFTDEDNLEAIFASTYAPINVTITSTNPSIITSSYSSFLYGGANLTEFSIGDDGKYYLGFDFSASLPSGPTLTTLKLPFHTTVGTLTLGGKTVDIFTSPPSSSQWSHSITASASVSILRYLEYDPGDGSGPVWDKLTGALLRQPYNHP